MLTLLLSAVSVQYFNLMYTFAGLFQRQVKMPGGRIKDIDKSKQSSEKVLPRAPLQQSITELSNVALCRYYMCYVWVFWHFVHYSG